MYVTAQKRKSVRDEEFRAFLRGAGYSDDQIDAIGPRVTERMIRDGGSCSKPASLT